MEPVCPESRQRPASRFAKIAFGLVGASVIGISALALPFLTPALRRHCLPFVPATDAQVRNVVEALHLRSRQKSINHVIDLGSGDGRIVIAAAKSGFRSTGVEVNRWLVFYSMWKSYLAGLNRTATFKSYDMWKVDLSQFDVIVVFGTETVMNDLSKKFIRDLKKDSCVITCRFEIPHWCPTSNIGSGIDAVWVYSMNDVRQILSC